MLIGKHLVSVQEEILLPIDNQTFECSKTTLEINVLVK